MTYSLTMGPATFWQAANRSIDSLVQSDSLHMVMLRSDEPMKVLLRSTTELFTDAAPRLAGSGKVIVNGNYYDVSYSGLIDAKSGSDPVKAEHTTPEGRLINKGKVIGGTVQKQMFYFAQTANKFIGPLDVGQPPRGILLWYDSGFGAVPVKPNMRSAIGGLGPIIIGGLKYGDGNLYGAGAPAAAPKSGKPPNAARPYLIQRNNNTYKDLSGRSVKTGKTILAAANNRGRLLVIVQGHGSSGQPLDKIRDWLFNLGFDHAVFLDGSDSSCIWHNGAWQIMPASDKNETNTVGVAFG